MHPADLAEREYRRGYLHGREEAPQISDEMVERAHKALAEAGWLDTRRAARIALSAAFQDKHEPEETSVSFEGRHDGEYWFVEIDYDCFTEREPFVVSIFTKHDDGEQVSETLAFASPQQAREMAAELLKHAEHAERSNRRVANAMRQEDG